MNLENIVSKYSSEFIFLRIISYLIDIFILMFFSSIISIIISIASKKFELVIWLIVFSITYILYFTLMEGFSGYTIGKFLLRIKVVDYQGKSPGIFKSLIRNIIRFFELNPLIFLGLISLIVSFSSNKKQRIGDIAASTFVVKYRDLLELKSFDNFKDNDFDLSEVEIFDLIKSNKINNIFCVIFIPISMITIILTVLAPTFSFSKFYIDSINNTSFIASKTYKSTDNNCKLSFPKGWIKTPSSTNSILSVTDKANSIEINLYKIDKTKYNNIYHYYISEIDKLNEDYKEISHSNLMAIVINNHEGLDYSYCYTDNKKTFCTYSTIIESEKNIYLISSKSLKSDFNDNKILIKNIPKTLKIISDSDNIDLSPDFEEKIINSRGILSN